MIIARSVFLYYAEEMAVRVAWFIRLSSVIFYPAAFVIAAVSKGTVHISSDRKAGETSHITKEGLKYILGEKTKGGDILTREKEMVNRVFDFSELTAVKIMVPISALTSLPASMKISEAVSVVADKKYMRIPVYEDTVYNIVGILRYFDLFEMLLKDRQASGSAGEATVASCMRKEVFYVPETKKVSELLAIMQKKDEQMAVVVDEYGGATGVVTIEDIGEEIVGTIDEYVAGEKLYRKISEGRYLVSGRLEMGTLRQLIKTVFPEGNYETVGGFLMQQMGRIPKPKEIYQYGGITFIIENADQKSIKEVMVISPAQ
jgi:CBS domain containing-hemolysin-like protein